jgi:hypothetical protein
MLKGGQASPAIAPALNGVFKSATADPSARPPPADFAQDDSAIGTANFSGGKVTKFKQSD